VVVAMTLSSNRVIKSSAVHVDEQNKILIDIAPPAGMVVLDGTPAPVATDEVAVAETEAARIIFTARQQADEVLRLARISAADEANSITSKATADAERMTTEAWDEAYKAGMEVAQTEGDAIREEAREILETAKLRRKQTEESLEPDMVALITAIVEKLIGDTVEIAPSVVINLIRQGLAGATLSGDVKIYVSDADYALVTANEEVLNRMVEGNVRLLIQRDSALNPMDCVIATEFGDIDCSLDQQLAGVTANLKFILDNR
jgi:flagellar assembly protein FliH